MRHREIVGAAGIIFSIAYFSLSGANASEYRYHFRTPRHYHLQRYEPLPSTNKLIIYPDTLRLQDVGSSHHDDKCLPIAEAPEYDDSQLPVGDADSEEDEAAINPDILLTTKKHSGR